MAKYASPEFLDGGYTAFKANVNLMVAIKAYSAGDSYATVFGNIVASVAVVTGDFALSGADAAARVMTGPSGKSDSSADASSGASPNLHIAFLDTVNSKVYWVTDETSDQVVTSGNQVNFPQLTYTRNQPT